MICQLSPSSETKADVILRGVGIKKKANPPDQMCLAYKKNVFKLIIELIQRQFTQEGNGQRGSCSQMTSPCMGALRWSPFILYLVLLLMLLLFCFFRLSTSPFHSVQFLLWKTTGRCPQRKVASGRVALTRLLINFIFVASLDFDCCRILLWEL